MLDVSVRWYSTATGREKMTNLAPAVQNLDNIQRVVSWRSTKNADGTFTGHVTSFDYGVSVFHASCIHHTRSQAVYGAKKLVRFVKAVKEYRARG